MVGVSSAWDEIRQINPLPASRVCIPLRDCWTESIKEARGSVHLYPTHQLSLRAISSLVGLLGFFIVAFDTRLNEITGIIQSRGCLYVLPCTINHLVHKNTIIGSATESRC